MRFTNRMAVGAGSTLLLVAGMMGAAAPAQAAGCFSYKTYSGNSQGAFSSCSGMISIQHRANVVCGDGTTRIGPWVGGTRQSTAWCPAGYAAISHSVTWEQTQA
jgi:hypothetical protein